MSANPEITLVQVGTWDYGKQTKLDNWYYYIWLGWLQFAHFPQPPIVEEPDFRDPFELVNSKPYTNPVFIYIQQPTWTRTPPNTAGWMWPLEHVEADNWRPKSPFAFTMFYGTDPFGVLHESRHLASYLAGCKNYADIGHSTEFCTT